MNETRLYFLELYHDFGFCDTLYEILAIYLMNKYGNSFVAMTRGIDEIGLIEDVSKKIFTNDFAADLIDNICDALEIQHNKEAQRILNSRLRKTGRILW